MPMSAIKLVGALSFLSVTGVMGQSSCVQLNATVFSSCPCTDATLTFTLEGETTVAANTVNLALILDGSTSISADDFALEKGFAEDTVAAFAARNLFDNGGTASYVQYASALVSSGTFDSAQLFNEFADADAQGGGGTTTSAGIDEGRVLLGANAATASFMVVITDGESASITDTTAAADEARLEGITVFAVGVGDGTGADELLAIGGDAANVFLVAEFDLLDAALESILSSDGGTVLSCPSTGATVTIEFGVPIDTTTSGTSNTVTFSAADLEATPTNFDVVLDVCGELPGGSVVVSAVYTDDQGNTPDLSLITGLVVGDDFCTGSTLPPAPGPTPTPNAGHTPTPNMAHTPTPMMVPTPTPHMVSTPAPIKEPTACSPTTTHKPDPKRGKHLKRGRAKHSSYLGCYVDDSDHRSLGGDISRSPHMTAQMCKDTCNSSGYEYFGTSSSECYCGKSEPTKKGGTCDYECSGDDTRACGGVGCMSIFKDDDYCGH